MKSGSETGASQTPPRSPRPRERTAGGLLPCPVVRLMVIAAAALAASIATPARCETGPSTASSGYATSQASLFGLRRNVGGRGVSLRQYLTPQSALALSASTGNRKELPEVRVLFGLQYLF